jgi:sugar transferase (PEP-CTERM/EpsH1 system associated)
MRVLFLTHRLPYAPNRGDRIRAYHILNELARCGEVDLVSLTHDDEEEAHAPELREIATTVHTARVPRMRNMARALTTLPTSRPLTHALLDAPDLRAIVAGLTARRRPDVVLAYCSGMARLLFDEALRSIPAIVDFVDVDSEKWRALACVTPPPRRWVYRREQRVLAAFEAAAARHARAAVVVNERERNSLVHIAEGARVEIVPNGIDLDAFQPCGAPARARTVIFCGVMNYAPNEHAATWLAEAVWPHVTRRRHDARLFLVGADPTDRVRGLAVDPSITVTGTVPDVRPFLWRSAVAVAPLTTARGIQNKVLEALASGLPTVVTPAVAQGLPAEVKPACAVARDPEAFAAAIVELLDMEAFARREMAMSANLSALGWSERLAPLVTLLREAAGCPSMAPDNAIATFRQFELEHSDFGMRSSYSKF